MLMKTSTLVFLMQKGNTELKDAINGVLDKNDQLMTIEEMMNEAIAVQPLSD